MISPTRTRALLFSTHALTWSSVNGPWEVPLPIILSWGCGDEDFCSWVEPWPPLVRSSAPLWLDTIAVFSFRLGTKRSRKYEGRVVKMCWAPDEESFWWREMRRHGEDSKKTGTHWVRLVQCFPSRRFVVRAVILVPPRKKNESNSKCVLCAIDTDTYDLLSK